MGEEHTHSTNMSGTVSPSTCLTVIAFLLCVLALRITQDLVAMGFVFTRLRLSPSTLKVRAGTEATTSISHTNGYLGYPDRHCYQHYSHLASILRDRICWEQVYNCYLPARNLCIRRAHRHTAVQWYIPVIAPGHFGSPLDLWGVSSVHHELQPAPSPSFIFLSSFSVPFFTENFCLSPVNLHASFIRQGEVVILNADSKILLQDEVFVERYPRPACFSPDGRFFARHTRGQDIIIWENTSSGYVIWNILRPLLRFENFSFSPSGTSVLSWGPRGTQLLDAKKIESSRSSTLCQALRNNSLHEHANPGPWDCRRHHLYHGHLRARQLASRSMEGGAECS